MNRTGPEKLIFFFLGAVFLFVLTLPEICTAQLNPMNDGEMAAITGQGTTNLVIEENTVRLFLDVHTETYGEIDSFKAGYYEKEINGTTSFGWDQNWTDVTLGESYDAPLVIDGLIVRVEFDRDITATDKKLSTIMVGTNNMAGQISGTFNSFTGAVHPGVIVPGQTGLPLVMNRDETLTGPLNINGGFFFQLNLDNNSPDRGIRTIVGYPETAAMDMTFSGLVDWWNQ